MTEDKFKPKSHHSSPVHVVKASTLGSDFSAAGQLVCRNIEELDAQQRNLVSDMKKLLPGYNLNNLSLIGCYQCADSRPLFANREDFGSLVIFRAMATSQQLCPETDWLNLVSYLPGTYLASGFDLIPSLNTTQKTYWSIRRFCPHTLADPTDLSAGITDLSPARSLLLIQELLSDIKQLEKHSAPHGHLTHSNIGWDEHSLYLLDPWYFKYSNQQLNPAQLTPAHRSERLGPRSLASLLLNNLRPCLSEGCLNVLISFISSNQDGLSFSDLYEALENVKETEQPDSSAAKETPPASPAGSYHSYIAPSGRVITPESKVTDPQPKKSGSTSSKIVVNRPVTASKLLARTSASGQKLSNQHFFFLLIAMAAAFFVLVSTRSINFFPSKYDASELEAAWKSNDFSELRKIAEIALLEKDATLQEFIAGDLLAGNERTGSKANILKIAFNDLWKDQLSGKDRFFAMALALAGLYRVPNNELPSIDQVHPAVLLALVGDLSLAGSRNKFNNIKTERLAGLAGSYGAVFSGLNEMGYVNVGDDPVRAAARLICGHSDRESIEYLLSRAGNEQETLRILALVVPFAEMYPDLASAFYSALVERSDISGVRSRWFLEEKLAEWNKVEVKDLLFITLGIVPESISGTDKLSDLLSFPSQNVRVKAKEKILQQIEDPLFSDLLDLLINKPGIITRPQLIALFATIQVPSDQAAPFVASWLQMEPDPGIVLEFLIASRNKRAFELSSVQLANYLARKDFEISNRQLPLLLTHPEALARTLAFPRLDPGNEVDRRILEQWYQSETSARIKGEIRKKLDG